MISSLPAQKVSVRRVIGQTEGTRAVRHHHRARAAVSLNVSPPPPGGPFDPVVHPQSLTLFPLTVTTRPAE